MAEFTNLFEKAAIGKMELRNRIIMAPGGTGGHGPEGEITDHLIDY